MSQPITKYSRFLRYGIEHRGSTATSRQPTVRLNAIAAALGQFLAVFGLMLTMSGSLAAQSGDTSREYTIKAAFLYNFGKYVEWPSEANADSAFTIAIVGDDPFGDALDAVARTKQLGGRPIKLLRIGNEDDDVDCHILFVPSGTAGSLVRPILAKARKRHCLIVGEDDGFAQSGGIINFYLQNNKVRFEINLTAAKRSRLQISSKLLRLGRIVDDSASPRD